MAWKEQEKGLPKWEPPSKEEIDSFTESLHEQNREVGQADISEFVQNQVTSLISKTLEGSKKLADSNEKILKSLNSLAKADSFAVDIIIPVYNNLQIVKPCLDALAERTAWPYKLTIVDDASDRETQEYLEWYCKETSLYQLIRNEKNKGFCATVNRGMRATSNPFICLLNSDVIVTENWLTKLVMALLSNDRNKIVNPVTNNTAEINVNMQPGYTYLDMNRALEKFSSRRYPEIMPTGFCFMMRRELVDTIGYFDEGFESYGEETDFWMKTISRIEDGKYPRWRAVLADDTYVFHERGTSFSSLGDEKHTGLRKAGSERFHSIWPGYRQWRATFQVEQILKNLRMELPPEALQNPKNKYNVAFVVHDAGWCGGMAVIADIVNELNERNVSAKVVVIKRKDDGKPPPVIHTLRSSPIFFDSPEDCVVNFEQAVFKQGIVIAATAELVPVVRKIAEGPGREDLLFAQSLDTELTDDPDISERMKKNIKAMSGKIIANSEWLQNHLEKEFKVKTLGFVRPGVNHDLFYPRNRDAGDDRKTVLFSLLRTYTHKGYERGVEVAQALSKLAKRNGKNIRLMAYGVLNIPECPEVIGLGDLNPGKMANLMGQEVDIFCDPAHIHTYGLPSIEAMISGAVPVLWDNYGVNEYGHDGNAVILPFSASPEKVANEIFNFLKDDLGLHRLEKYRESGLNTHQSRTKSVTEFIDLLEKSYDLYDPKRKIAVVTPHLRKHGGPSTILHMANEIKDLGHEVELVTLYPDINPEVIEMCRVPVNLDYKNLGEYDVLISNSDNPENALFVMNPKIKKKVMLKLSHNPRFLSLENESLKLPWDAIMTSTQWLKDVCLNPTKEEGWNYTPKDASRIGWYHYGHEIFSCPPKERQYGDLSNQLVICGLAHQHPLKGTQESLDVMYKLKQQFVDQIHMTMVGEWPQFQQNHPKWLQYFFSLNRSSMAQLFRKIDIWICTSKTEGLGRLLLENMSASVAVVTLDTGAEFAKHRENCMVVNSEAEMTNAIVELIKNPELRMEICANAHETAKQYADPTEFRQNLRSVIQGVYE